MKKTTFLCIGMLLLLEMSSAQSEFGINPFQEQPTLDKPIRKANQTIDSKALKSSSWFNFFADIRDIWGFDIVYFRSTLFSDSSVLVQNGSSFDYAFKHGYGQSFDPTSGLFESPISSAAEYSLDSISIPYMYFRPQKNNPDTLIISVFRESQLNINPSPGWSTPRSYSNAPYDTVGNKGLNPEKEIVYILDDKDEQSSVPGFLEIGVDMDFDPGEILAVTISYFPGNPVFPGDTLGNTLEPFGPKTKNGFAFYDGRDNTAALDNGFYNMGQWITTPIAYNLLASTNGWEGSYIPGVAYGNSSGVRHMDINFKITYDDFTGINEMRANAYNFGVYPNPATESARFRFDFNQMENASIQLFDVLGNLVLENRLDPAHKSMDVNVSEISKGMYFAKLIVGNKEAASVRLMVK